MKKYTTDMAKLISLVIITPLLVMAYTKVESSVSASTPVQTQVEITGATPFSIGLLDKIKTAPIDNFNKNENINYILVRSIWPVKDRRFKETGNSQSTTISNRFALVLL